VRYLVEILNIESIQKPVGLKEIIVQAGIKAEAMEKAHQKAEEEYPDAKIVISVQELGSYT
jgi:Ni,Fe-hydrogenase III small subunit